MDKIKSLLTSGKELLIGVLVAVYTVLFGLLFQKYRQATKKAQELQKQATDNELKQVEKDVQNSSLDDLVKLNNERFRGK